MNAGDSHETSSCCRRFFISIIDVFALFFRLSEQSVYKVFLHDNLRTGIPTINKNLITFFDLKLHKTLVLQLLSLPLKDFDEKNSEQIVHLFIHVSKVISLNESFRLL